MLEFPRAIDSSMLATFRSCPQRFFREYLEHWKPKSPSIHLHAGGAFAKGLEIARTSFYEQNLSAEESEARGLEALITSYGLFDCPQDSNKTLERMCGALEFYFTRFPLDRDAATPLVLSNGRRAIEFTFALPLALDLLHPETKEPILYCGRCDMLVDFAGGKYGEDDKTTSQLGPSWSRNWVMRSQFSGYCLKGEDEVLTRTGWKQLKELQAGQEMVQWEESGKLSFTTPTAIHSPYFEGDMIETKGKINLCATTDHRQILFDQYSKTYKTFQVKDIVKTNGSLRFISAGQLEGGEEISNDFLRLLVAFQADGSWKDKTAISFHFTKDRKANRLETIFKSLGIKFQKHNTKGHSYRINTKELICAEVMKFLGKEKLFGDWILKLSQANLKTFTEEVKYWDGTDYTKTKWMYFSTIPANVEWVATACALAGLHTSKHVQVSWKGSKDHHRLIITTGILHSVHTLQWGTTYFEGQVYCVTVPSSYFLVRSKGTTFITGNCWASQQVGIDVCGMIVRGISILKTKYDSAEVITNRSPFMIERWRKQTISDIKRMIRMWERYKVEGPDAWDFNLDHACTEFGGCSFVRVCESPEPEAWVNMYFEKRVWDPLAREETKTEGEVK